MFEGIIIFFLVIIMITFFGIRKLLFGDNPFLQGKKGIQTLLTGDNQTSMLEEPDHLIGKIGIVYTVLKPAGKIVIDDEHYEATTNGDFIGKGEKVKVIGKTMTTVLKVRPLFEGE
ncbi:NfeD family protein [Flexithrix dorotheae]|uniref:NfeD family protein n=1 Tax=Flexithrix dorotheae TaxID=70993 RepID=UPI000377FEF5|nr:NfeD family protein [Flexithrix dorotheae]